MRRADPCRTGGSGRVAVAVMFVLGGMYFRRVEDSYADIIG